MLSDRFCHHLNENNDKLAWILLQKSDIFLEKE